MTRQWTRRLPLLAGIVVATAAATLRLYRLTEAGLWHDEGGSLAMSDGNGVSIVLDRLANTTMGDHFQPLYFFLLYLWRSVAGSTVFSLRILSVVLSLAALAAIWMATARAFGRTHALITAALVATSAFFVLHAQEARPYALLLLLGALLLLFFLHVRDARILRSFPAQMWAMWVCLGIGMFASVTMGIMAAGLALGDAFVERHLGRWLRTWLPCAVAALPSIVFFLMSSAALDPRGAGVTHISGSLLRNAVFALYGIAAGTTYGPPLEPLHLPGATQLVLQYWPSLLVLAIALAAALLAALLAIGQGDVSPEERRIARVLVIAFLASYGLMLAFAFVSHLNWQPRHSFFLALPLFMLLPFAVRRAPQHSRWRPILGGVALAVIALANAHSLAHYYWDDAYDLDDYRGVAQYVTAEARSGRQPVLLFGDLGLLRYYGDRATVYAADQDQLAASVHSVTAGAREILLISNREWANWQQPESIVEAMSPKYRFDGAVGKYPYFTLYRFTLRERAETPATRLTR